MTPVNAAPHHTGQRPAPAGLFRAPKVQPWHLDRLAVVYVRQSTAQQVAENKESTDRQYGLVNRAIELGWPPDRILVIDDDQGKSGSSAEGRPGFQRLLAEVGLDHVGLVLGLEMSRLARSCKDWHQLIELCAMFRVLLADQDGLYDPTDHNDRLLLGLTGIMSEAELHLLRGRMRQGLLNKVARGEVFMCPSVGYVRSPVGGYDFDPDEQVRAVVRMVFDQFERLGTIRKVLRYLVANDIRLGIRPHAGPNRGQLEWRTATRETVSDILHHPIYAGYYCFGRRQADPRRRKPGRRWSGRVLVTPDEYLALIPDKVPAYITREQYDANQRRIAENRARIEYKGAPREGLSLLAGLVVCGRCGKRMTVHYAGRADPPLHVPDRGGGRARDVLPGAGRQGPRSVHRGPGAGRLAARGRGAEPLRGRRRDAGAVGVGRELATAVGAGAHSGDPDRAAVSGGRTGEPARAADAGAAVGRGVAGGPAAGRRVRPLPPDATDHAHQSRAGSDPQGGP